MVTGAVPEYARRLFGSVNRAGSSPISARTPPNEAALKWRSLVCVQRLCCGSSRVAFAIQLRERGDDLRFVGLKAVPPANVAQWIVVD